jgi:hypothetical protein
VESRVADVQKLMSGGDESINEAKSLIEYLNSAEWSAIFSSVQEILKGKLGVEIRRGNVNLDLVINGGNPVPNHHEKILESNNIQLSNIFGETEHPQSGGLKIERDNQEGFRLPFDSQINLVYIGENNKISYEGSGRFAYLPFGLEGQAIPGIYISDVSCMIRSVGGKYQLLSDVERVTTHQGTCYQE